MGSAKKLMMYSCQEVDQPASTNSSKRISPVDGSEALSNNLVLKQIFTLLDTRLLIELSMVNKLWCATVRSVLRTQRRCVAGVKGSSPCLELLQLNSQLMTHEDHPYSGLAIRTGRASFPYVRRNHRCIITDECARGMEGGEVESMMESSSSKNSHSEKVFVYSAIMEKIKFRILEIYWPVEKPSCPAEKLLFKILMERREEIVEMKITGLPPMWALREHLGIETEHWLPNLKVLTFYPRLKESTWSQAKQDIKYELIKAAPQLQKLFGFNDHSDVDFFVENDKVTVMKHFAVARNQFYDAVRQELNQELNQIHDAPQNQLLGRFVQLASFEPKLTHLLVKGYYLEHDPNSAPYRAMADFMTSLLESSASSLEGMKLDQAVFIHPLPYTFDQPFPVLKELTLGINSSIDQWFGSPTLERFDWTGFFPVLQTVTLTTPYGNFPYEHPVSSREQGNVEDAIRENILKRPTGSPCESVQRVAFDGMDVKALGYLGRLFPNVKEFLHQFKMRIAKLQEILEFLWTTWPNLERINISNVPEYAVAQNLDAFLCGISKEEAIAYRKKSTESLRAVALPHGVSSILSFRCLKRLRIEVLHQDGEKMCGKSFRRDSSLDLVTHVTGLLAFARMPGFEMEVARDLCSNSMGHCEYQLEHLRLLSPFVKLTDNDHSRNHRHLENMLFTCDWY